MFRTLAFAVVLFTPAVAFAQSTGVDISRTKGDEILYDFLDADGLSGSGIVEHSARITVRPPASRVFLVRPRASFVPELQKSVENI